MAVGIVGAACDGDSHAAVIGGLDASRNLGHQFIYAAGLILHSASELAVAEISVIAIGEAEEAIGGEKYIVTWLAEIVVLRESRDRRDRLRGRHSRPAGCGGGGSRTGRAAGHLDIGQRGDAGQPQAVRFRGEPVVESDHWESRPCG